jgi:uncharacterized protein YecT (DUF1311 family)
MAKDRSAAARISVVAAIAGAGAVALLLLPGRSTPAPADALVPPVIPHPGSTAEPCPAQPQTTPEIVACLEKRLESGDKRIDQLNQDLFPELANPSMKREFVAAYQAWFNFRQQDCAAMSAIYEGGTIQPVVELECAIARDKQRIANLREFQQLLNP